MLVCIVDPQDQGHVMTRAMSKCFKGILVSLGLLISAVTQAVSLTVNIAPPNSVADLSGAVVYLVDTAANHNDTAAPTPPIAPKMIAQSGRLFDPYINVIQTGTEVIFPNRDSVAHHVYSFSAARAFELPLYKNELTPSITFEKPGLITLGCNIHDWMLGYILVVDTPYFQQLSGLTATFEDIPTGQYLLSFWAPDMDQREAAQLLVNIGSSNQTVSMPLSYPIKTIHQPQPPENNIDQRDDYL